MTSIDADHGQIDATRFMPTRQLRSESAVVRAHADIMNGEASKKGLTFIGN